MKFLTVLQAQDELAGLDEAPTDICNDRDIGTWEGQNAEQITLP